MKKIEVDEEVYNTLLKLSESFRDTPNNVLRKILGLNKKPSLEGLKDKEEVLLEEMMEKIGIKKTTGTIQTKNKITPEKDYFLPILESLLELGGSAQVDKVLEQVGKKMNDTFTEADLELLPSGKELRWRNKAQWARLVMVKQGYLKSDSPRGIWEITDKGKEYFEKATKK
jgi:predicted CopG family antitoxin